MPSAGAASSSDGLGERAEQCGVDRVVAEQVAGHPVGHAQSPGEEGTIGVLDLEQPVRDQWRARRRAGRGRVASAGDRPAISNAKPDRGAAARDVVVEVAVKPLEPAVDIGHERDDQQLDVDVGEAGSPGELAQHAAVAPACSSASAPRSISARRSCVRLGLAGAGPAQQPVDTLVGEVQAAERIVGRGIVLPPMRRRARQRAARPG